MRTHRRRGLTTTRCTGASHGVARLYHIIHPVRHTRRTVPAPPRLGRGVPGRLLRARRLDLWPEEAAGTAAWIVAGLRPELRWPCTSLGILATGCRPYRCGVTIGRFMHEAVLRHHGRDQAAWIVHTLTRGNIGGPERLPGGADPWRGTMARAELAEAA